MKENEMVKIGGKLFRQFAPIDFDGYGRPNLQRCSL